MRIFAHRGANRLYTEHTRAAYLEALRQGADGLETDVRLSADGQVVCWHDATAKRLTGESAFIHEMTLARLKELDLIRGAQLPNGFGAPDEQLMTLPALLDLMRAAERPVALALEIKQPSPGAHALDRAVLAALSEAGWDPQTGEIGNVTVDLMSFWPQSVAALRGMGVGDALLSLLLEDADSDDLERWVEHETQGRVPGGAAAAVRDAAGVRDQLVGDPAIGLGPGMAVVRDDPDSFKRWAQAGRRLRVWTVNDVDDALFCRDLGIAEITTDLPAEMRTALTSH